MKDESEKGKIIELQKQKDFMQYLLQDLGYKPRSTYLGFSSFSFEMKTDHLWKQPLKITHYRSVYKRIPLTFQITVVWCY